MHDDVQFICVETKHEIAHDRGHQRAHKGDQTQIAGTLTSSSTRLLTMKALTKVTKGRVVKAGR